MHQTFTDVHKKFERYNGIHHSSNLLLVRCSWSINCVSSHISEIYEPSIRTKWFYAYSVRGRWSFLCVLKILSNQFNWIVPEPYKHIELKSHKYKMHTVHAQVHLENMETTKMKQTKKNEWKYLPKIAAFCYTLQLSCVRLKHNRSL